jgi:outer membrane protein assembly factor BamD
MRLLLLSSLLWSATALAAPGAGTRREVTPEDRYELCLKYLQRAYYTKALEQCNRVRNYHRDDPVSVKAELAIADIHFKKGDYEEARLAYEDFIRLHPRYPEMDYVVYRSGLSIWKLAPRWAGRDQTTTRAAVTAWSGFSTRFPDSPDKEEVEELLGKGRDRLALKELQIGRFYAQRGKWKAAIGRSRDLVRKYPESSLVPAALALQAVGQHALGDTDAALATRGVLAERFPDSPELARLDRDLARPPGQPPEEEVFVRPYHYPGMGMPGMGGMGGY